MKEPGGSTDALIVLGMHRSGTSVTTAALHAMGAYVGVEEELTGRARENPQGFFERRDVRNICDGLLRSAQAEWWKVIGFETASIPDRALSHYLAAIAALKSELDNHGLWAIKEPRLCLLLPIFRRAIDRPRIVYPFRDPLEVASSLQRRNGIPLVAGLALWEAYNIHALRNSADLPRVFVNYGDLVTAPRETLARLAEELAKLGVAGIDSKGAVDVVRPELHRERRGDPEADAAPLTPSQSALWAALAKGMPERAPRTLAEDAARVLEEFEREYEDRQLQNLSAKLKAVQADSVGLASKILDRDLALGTLKATLDEHRHAVDNLQSTLDSRDGEILRLRALLRDIEHENEELRLKLEGGVAKLEESVLAISAKDAETKQLRLRLRTKKKRAKERSAKLRSLGQELRLKEKELRRLSARSWLSNLLRRPTLTSTATERIRVDAQSGANIAGTSRLSLEDALTYAEAASSERNWLEAAKRWQAVLDGWGDKSPGRAFARLARALRAQRDLSAANAAIARGLALHPKDLGLTIERAELAMTEKDWHEAALRWQVVIESEKPPIGAFANLARCLLAIGDGSGAELALADGMARHGDHPALVASLAEVEMARENWVEAREHLRASLRRPNISLDEMNQTRINISVLDRLIDLPAYAARIERYQQDRTKRRYVVYSAIVGKHDAIQLPSRISDKFDYVLFTDHPTHDTGVLQIRPLTYLHDDPTRAARFVKTHPHVLVGDYDVAVWLDASIMILDDLEGLVVDFIRSGRPIAGVPHAHRSSLYEEFEACLLLKKDDPAIIENQRAEYRLKGFDSTDLIESGWMMFNLNHQVVAPFLDGWWTEIDRHSRRDQLSVNFAMNKCGADWFRLTAPPVGIRNNDFIALSAHGASQRATLLVEALKSPIVDPYVGTPYAGIRDERIVEAGKIRIDIVVCVHDALDDVKRCLESVMRTRRGDNMRLVIVDDGSGEPTRGFLAAFAEHRPWIDLLRNDIAVGYARAANQGAAGTTGDFMVLLNSDTIVTDGWVEKMADALFSTKGAGVVGPLSNAASHQSIPEHRSSNNQTAINDLPAGLTPEDMNRWCERWTMAGVLPRVPLTLPLVSPRS